jgi:hypothetical protein
MRVHKVRFQFNSAITPRSANDTSHKAAIEPVVETLKALVGIGRVYIDRYHMTVAYDPDVVSRTAVIQYIRQVMHVSNKNHSGLFPSLGDKKLRLTNTTPPELWVVIAYDSSLVKLPVGARDIDEMVDARASGLTEKMVDIDGVSGYNTGLRLSKILVDTSVTSLAAAKAHLKTIFAEAARGKEYFPYKNDGEVPKFRIHVEQPPF